MNSPKRNAGFTLIELLVVISIIGILASLAIPAVNGALVRGQMTQTLNNVRQLHLATSTMDLDNSSAGVGGGFPGSSNAAVPTYAKWIEDLTNGNYLTASDLRKLFSAQRVAADDALSAGSIALNVYDTTSVSGEGISESELPFLSTKNWDGTTPTTPPSSTAQPYGDKGVVVMRRGGEGQILQARLVNQSNVSGPAASGKLN